MSKKLSDIKTGQKMISWEAEEFAYHSKTLAWYLIITAIAVILIAFFYWQKTYAGIAVVAASILALFMQAQLKPKNIKYTFTSEGLEFQGKSYSFNDLKTFWITEGPTGLKLFFLKTGKFTNPIAINLDKTNLPTVRNFLQQYLPENSQGKEHFNERISRFMRF